MKLDGAVALVTGAGKGIGRSIALSLASHGTTVALNARTESDLNAVRTEIEAAGGKAEVLPADLRSDDALHGIFRGVDERFGRLDILVNNAGIGKFAPVRDLAVEDLDAMWDLNMRALFLCTKEAVDRMEKSGGGAIVNVASLAGRNAFIGGAGYAATKWALIGFSRCLMLEVRDKGIRVITICPGSVDTEFSGSRDPERAPKILAPEDVAETVLSALRLPPRAMVSEIDIRPTNPR